MYLDIEYLFDLSNYLDLRDYLEKSEVGLTPIWIRIHGLEKDTKFSVASLPDLEGWLGKKGIYKSKNPLVAYKGKQKIIFTLPLRSPPESDHREYDWISTFHSRDRGHLLYMPREIPISLGTLPFVSLRTHSLFLDSRFTYRWVYRVYSYARVHRDIPSSLS